MNILLILSKKTNIFRTLDSSNLYEEFFTYDLVLQVTCSIRYSNEQYARVLSSVPMHSCSVRVKTFLTYLEHDVRLIHLS